MTYSAPIADMRFLLEHVIGFSDIAGLPGYEEASPDLVDAVLEESGRISAEVLAPLNHSGDIEGCSFENGVVRTPKGFPEAQRKFAEGGWVSLPFSAEHGGQGLPWTLAFATAEMWQSANMSFALCPLLTSSAIELLETHGSERQKSDYLSKLLDGDWTGTMNLTEPQAGSDVGSVKTRAEAHGDHYLIRGQKIYITWGEHDCAENIIHMVLARTPGAPAGTKGISLFIVPKFLLDGSGGLGPRNDLRCVSIEHKLGIQASPTAVMSYGDNEGAVGYLVGEENRGIEYMFTMMNNARLAVAVQGTAIAERAYQQARCFASERHQGRSAGAGRDAGAVPIIRHPDVRRMLMSMKAKTEAARALCFFTAAALDRAKAAPDAKVREAAAQRCDLLTPIAKAWATDTGCEVTSLGIQIHGGMGFIEETGAAQHYRDARILPIYEGTNGIQAIDLLGRKVLRDGGTGVAELLAEIEVEANAIAETQPDIAAPLAAASSSTREAGDWLLAAAQSSMEQALAGATPYCRMMGTTIGGWLLARAARAAEEVAHRSEGDAGYLDAKIKTARFYALNILPHTAAQARAVTEGAESVLSLEEVQF